MTLDVLLLESAPGDGASDARDLEAAGHRVHRCFDGHDAGTVHPSGLLPCRALTDGDCPLDATVDVVLLARRGIAPRPGPREVGIRCAIRAGLPIVEDGGDLLDPFDQWITRRTDHEGVVQACEGAAADAFGPVVARLRTSCAAVLAEHDVDPDGIDARFRVEGDGLVVTVTGSSLAPPVARAVCDRAREAVRALPRRFRTVGVGYAARS